MSGSKTRAVTLMLLSALSFSIMQVFVKMSSTEVGTFEQVFFRNLVSMIIAGITVYREKLDLIPEIKKGGLTLWGRSFSASSALYCSFTPPAMHGRRMLPC